MSALRLINETSASSVSSVSITDVFTSDFDIYKIVATGMDTSVEDWIYFRFINSSGSVVTASNYDSASLYLRSWTTFSEQRFTNSSAFTRWTVQDVGSEDSGGVVTYVFNPYSSSSYSFLLNQSSFNTSLGEANLKGIMVLKQTASMTGFYVYPNSGTLDNIQIRTYGLRVDNG